MNGRLALADYLLEGCNHKNEKEKKRKRNPRRKQSGIIRQLWNKNIVI